MGDLGVDLLLASDWINAGYLAGHFLDPDLFSAGAIGINSWGYRVKGVLSPYENFVAIPRDKGEEAFFVHSNQDTYACFYEQCWIKERIPYGPGLDPVEVVAKSLKESNLDRGHIALVYDAPVRTFERLKRVLPRVSFRDGSDIVWKLRMVKTTEEIERMRKAADATDRAATAAFDAATEGTTELEMQKSFRTALAQQEVYAAFNHIHFGEYPFVEREKKNYPSTRVTELPVDSHNRTVYDIPTERKLEKGDRIALDAGARYHSYVSDIQRYAKLGKLTSDEAEYFRKISMVFEKVREEFRPGAIASNIYSAAIRETENAGLRLLSTGFGFAGHGVGIQVHEPPFIVPNDDTTLEKGMTLNPELCFYDVKFNGLNEVEDTILITENGNEPLVANYAPRHIQELT
jgi:Xaa-Pro aminopeptidase